MDTGTRALLAHRLALRCGDRWQSEAIPGQGNDQATHIPLSSPGWGLRAGGPDVRGVRVFDLHATRIPSASAGRWACRRRGELVPGDTAAVTSEHAALELEPAVVTVVLLDGTITRHPESHFLDPVVNGRSLRAVTQRRGRTS